MVLALILTRFQSLILLSDVHWTGKKGILYGVMAVLQVRIHKFSCLTYNYLLQNCYTNPTAQSPQLILCQGGSGQRQQIADEDGRFHIRGLARAALRVGASSPTSTSEAADLDLASKAKVENICK